MPKHSDEKMQYTANSGARDTLPSGGDQLMERESCEAGAPTISTSTHTNQGGGFCSVVACVVNNAKTRLPANALIFVYHASAFGHCLSTGRTCLSQIMGKAVDEQKMTYNTRCLYLCI